MILIHDTPTNRLLNMRMLSARSAVEGSATGNPLTFLTDLAKPLKSLLIPFTPQQEGSGDPSPENIRSIIPWNGLKVWNGGKNLFNASAVIRRDGYLLNDNGVEQSSSQSGYTQNRTKVKAGSSYTISGTIIKGSETCRLYFYNGDTFVSRTGFINVNGIPYTFTVPSGCDGVALQYNMVTVDFSTVQLEAGQTATSYEPYHPITETDIVFPSPVYGGTLDVVSGVLSVEWVMQVLDGSEAWTTVSTGTGGAKYYRFSVGDEGYLVSGEMVCDTFKTVRITSTTTDIGINAITSPSNHKDFIGIRPGIEEITDSATLKAWLAEHNITAVYKLSTPQEITLTPEQITAIVGDNTIWSDADGSMTAVYLKKG